MLSLVTVQADVHRIPQYSDRWSQVPAEVDHSSTVFSGLWLFVVISA